MKKYLLFPFIFLTLIGCFGKEDIEELYVTKDYDKILVSYEKKPDSFDDEEKIYVANAFYTKGEEEKAIKLYDEIFKNEDHPLTPPYQLGLEYYENHKEMTESIAIYLDGKEIYKGKSYNDDGEILIPLNPIINETEGGIYVPLGEDYFYAKNQDFRLEEGMEYSITGAKDSCYGIFDSTIGSQIYTIIEYETDDLEDEGFEVEKSFRCSSVLEDGYLFLHPKDIDELIMNQLGWEMRIDGQNYIFGYVGFSNLYD
ncbi:MAG: hypothetical protein Q4Q07_08960 [Tissierellia bacterium]|nr:hypothetical protein [Tissierellia bacterium]